MKKKFFEEENGAEEYDHSHGPCESPKILYRVEKTINIVFSYYYLSFLIFVFVNIL